MDNNYCRQSGFIQHYSSRESAVATTSTNYDASSRKDKIKEAELERRRFLSLGLSGLENMGNTCYLAATIQLLSNCPILQTIMRDRSILRDIGSKIIESDPEKFSGAAKNTLLEKEFDDMLTYQLYKVMTTMWNTNSIVRPRSVKKIIGQHDTLAGFGQHDSQEALQFVLQHIHDETKKNIDDVKFIKKISETVNEKIEQIKKCSNIIDESLDVEEKKRASDILMNMYKEDPSKYLKMMMIITWKKTLLKEGESFLTYLTWGLFCAKRTCTECAFMSPTFDMFNMIQLAIPEDKKDLTLKDCFDYYSQSEDVECKCARCGNKKATQESNIYSYPDILFIHFKRFESEYANGKLINRKRYDKITFPLENLTFKEFSIEKDDEITKNYDLKGIIEHRGSLDSGHYVSYCQNPVSEEWFEFNDDDVLRIPKEDIEKEIVTSNAYLLMYVRRFEELESDDSDDDS